MEIVPIFSSLGATAGILHEITKHEHETQREELPPAGSFVKGALLGGVAGLAADIGLQHATRRREHKRSGTTGGHYRGGHQPNRAHYTNEPRAVVGGPTPGLGTPTYLQQEGLIRGRPRRSGKSGNKYGD